MQCGMHIVNTVSNMAFLTMTSAQPSSVPAATAAHVLDIAIGLSHRRSLRHCLQGDMWDMHKVGAMTNAIV